MSDAWDALFADLEGELAARRRAELEDEVAERVRAERARIGLADRLAAARGRRVVLRTADGGALGGQLGSVGRDWVRLGADGARWLVPLGSIHGVTGLTERARPADGDLSRRVTWVTAVRGLSRDRVPVRLGLTSGHVLEGRLDRVLGDHLDLASGSDLRSPRATEAVSFAAICWVGSREVPGSVPG